MWMEALAEAELTLLAMNFSERQALLQDIVSVPRGLPQLRAVIVRHFHAVIPCLLLRFGQTLRVIYDGLRAVRLCRSGRTAAVGSALALNTPWRHQFIAKRGGRCAATGFGISNSATPSGAYCAACAQNDKQSVDVRFTLP
jgi:hypothetical protein